MRGGADDGCVSRNRVLLRYSISSLFVEIDIVTRMDPATGQILKYGADATVKGAGVLNKLFPEIAMGSNRRGAKRDLKQLTKLLSDVDSNKDLSDEEKALLRYSLYKNLGHIDNLESIVSGSVPLIKDSEKSEQVDSDWIDDFEDKAGRCSDPELQKLWSQILAGEVNSPTTFPRRLLTILSTLDKTEAESFKTLCAYSARQYDINHPEDASHVVYIFLNQDEDGTYNNGNFTVDQAENLVEAGLLSASAWHIIRTPINSIRTLATSAEMITIMNQGGENRDVAPANYMLTKAGIALATLCDLGNAQDFHAVLRASIPSELSVSVTPLQPISEEQNSRQPLIYL